MMNENKLDRILRAKSHHKSRGQRQNEALERQSKTSKDVLKKFTKELPKELNEELKEQQVIQQQKKENLVRETLLAARVFLPEKFSKYFPVGKCAYSPEESRLYGNDKWYLEINNGRVQLNYY